MPRWPQGGAGRGDRRPRHRRTRRARPGSGTRAYNLTETPDDPALLGLVGSVYGQRHRRQRVGDPQCEPRVPRRPRAELRDHRAARLARPARDRRAAARSTGRHRDPAADRRRDLGPGRHRRRHGHGRLRGHVRAPRPAVQPSPRSGVFGDVRVRQAFLLVVPRQQILDDLVAAAAAGCRAARLVRPASRRRRLRRRHREQRLARLRPHRRRRGQPPARRGRRRRARGSASCTTRPTPAGSRSSSLIATSAARAGFLVTDCSNSDWEGLLGVAGTYDAALFAWDTTRLGPAAASASSRAIPSWRTSPVQQPRGRRPDRRGRRVRRSAPRSPGC